MDMDKLKLAQNGYRFAYFLYRGKIPDDKIVMHQCNNSACCNPNHLKLGTQSDNMRYKVECGRWNNYGESNGLSKLTSEQIREIHLIHKNNPQLEQKEIAKKFSTTQENISYILNGVTWNHIYKEFHKEQ